MNKSKIGLPPNKRYHLTLLARHKSENRSKYCHLWYWERKEKISDYEGKHKEPPGFEHNSLKRIKTKDENI